MYPFIIFKNTVLLFVLGILTLGCQSKSNASEQVRLYPHKPIEDSRIAKPIQAKNSIVGANLTYVYLPVLKGKRIGVVANQTSVIFKNDKTYTHLVDSLLALNITIKKVFAPEHGFRGKANAGELVKDGIDTKTNLPIISLYGKNKKPSPEQLKGLDYMLFDIQDVGARFYTYISSLHYVMEACAEANIPLMVLDRPNPNGHYIDGPILETAYKSFVGMHPIPVTHGMTIGEYAKMINGEKWLANGIQCRLDVIPIKHYNHQLPYALPIKPSPNLPNAASVALYPSLCFFEGTNVSAGRGTEHPFQIFGSPFLSQSLFPFQFTPTPNHGSKHPKHEGTVCFGKDLTKIENGNTLNLKWLIEAYKHTQNKSKFFTSFFTKLAGSKTLQKQIEKGVSEKAIKASWENGLTQFKKIRKQYLIYP